MLKSCASFHLSRTGVVSKQPSRDWTDERRRPDGNYSQAIEEICPESGKEGRIEPRGDEVGDGRRAGDLGARQLSPERDRSSAQRTDRKSTRLNSSHVKIS